jgi:NADH-quinone oxidoreductase subunit N
LFVQNTIQSVLLTSIYSLAILYYNVYVYIMLLYMFFSLLFLFDIKQIKTLNNLKIFNKIGFISITVVLLFLSMSGIPPLAGFVSKFLLFNFLFFMQKYSYIFLFSFLNFFSIYFYIQNLRFLISKTQLNFFLVNGYHVFFSKDLVNILVLLNLFNFFSIIYFEDFIYIFINLFLNRL